MSEKVPNGNKVADVHVENGYTMSEKKPVGNKISDSNLSVKTVTSEDSCSKLTKDNSEGNNCMGGKPAVFVVKLLICGVCGIFFGIALEKGRGKFNLY